MNKNKSIGLLSLLILTGFLILSCAPGPDDIDVDERVEEIEYQNSYEDTVTGLTLFWGIDDPEIYIGIESEHEGWSAIGVAPGDTKLDAAIILVAIEGEEAIIRGDFGDGEVSHMPLEEQKRDAGILSYEGQRHDIGYSFEFVLAADSAFGEILESPQGYDIILAVHATSNDFDEVHTLSNRVNINLD